MSSFIAPKKKSKKQDLPISESKDSFIIIPNISIVNLDKEFIMKDITENATKKLITKPTKSKLTFLDNSIELPPANEINVKEISKKSTRPSLKNRESSSFISNENSKQDDKKHFDLKFVTKLESLGISNEQKIVNFETIIKHEPINVKMFCSSSKKQVVPTPGMSCWWCRHSIPANLFPIGLPIKYKKGLDNEESQFETEGYFCSFNCILAYNNEMCINNIRYRETGSLIYILYKKIFDKFPQNMSIKPALSWKLLKAYGGSLSINEFRNAFQIIDELAINYIKSKQINIVQNNVAYIEETSNQKSNQNVY
jgi:hypothetical protein